MTTLPLSADELLTTTRSVRKRLDLSRPVPPDLIRECLQIALQAPSGSNRQGWGWIVVTDAGQRRALGELYRQAVSAYLASDGSAAKLFAGDPARAAVQQRSRSVVGGPQMGRHARGRAHRDHRPTVVAATPTGG